MHKLISGVAFALIVSLAGLGGSAAHDAKHEASPEASPIASPMAMSTGAAFMTITNDGEAADRLISAETDMAETVEIHEVAEEAGVMKMRPLADGLEIPAGESVELVPGGYHVMLIGLTESLMPGETFELTLTFEQAGDVTVTALIVMGNEKPEEGMAESVTVGDDIVVSDVWSRGAPAMHN